MADMPGLRFRVDERTPAHTMFRVFVGDEGHGGFAGLLTFRNEEYDRLAPALLAAGDMLAALEAVPPPRVTNFVRASFCGYCTALWSTKPADHPEHCEWRKLRVAAAQGGGA